LERLFANRASDELYRAASAARAGIQ